MDCDTFIDEIRRRPEIWHLKHPDRKNKFKVMKRWNEVRRNYSEFTVDELKKRWKNLKDTYRKELKRLPQTRPGVPADNLKSGWRYFDALSFLRDELSFQGKEQDDSNCITYTTLTSPQEPEKYQVAPAYSEPACQSPAISVESLKSDEEAEEPAISKRKTPGEVREEFLRLERKKMKILEDEIARNNEHMNSDNYHFLMSLLPEMDKLSPVQKMRLRTKISQAVLEEVSLAAPIFNEQPAYTEVDFQAGQLETVNIIKEEAINMYE